MQNRQPTGKSRRHHQRLFLDSMQQLEGSNINYTTLREDLKLSFRGNIPTDIPTDDTFKPDFHPAIDNAKWFLQQIAIPKTINKGLLTVTQTLSDSLCFRHVVFEVSVPSVFQTHYLHLDITRNVKTTTNNWKMVTTLMASNTFSADVESLRIDTSHAQSPRKCKVAKADPGISGTNTRTY